MPSARKADLLTVKIPVSIQRGVWRDVFRYQSLILPIFACKSGELASVTCVRML
ncbi:hypothetical protein ACU8KH_05813 [Lachancea thermotolerans]